MRSKLERCMVGEWQQLGTKYYDTVTGEVLDKANEEGKPGIYAMRLTLEVVRHPGAIFIQESGDA